MCRLRLIRRSESGISVRDSPRWSRLMAPYACLRCRNPAKKSVCPSIVQWKDRKLSLIHGKRLELWEPIGVDQWNCGEPTCENTMVNGSGRKNVKMIYLSGIVRRNLNHPMIGFMLTPQMGNAVPMNAVWAADNGRFSSPEKYTDDGYLSWLLRQPVSSCLFAVAPDVLADHEATVELSCPLLPRIRSIGCPAAFVAQDGWEPSTTPWDDFDVLFIGGTTKFKLGRGGEAISYALQRGKRVHMGRVNSYRRLRLAAVLGCTSADGTFLKAAPDINEPKMLRWMNNLISSPMLELAS